MAFRSQRDHIRRMKRRYVISNARRSLRELVLAYRIARARVHRESDRIHFFAWEHALEQLIAELARQTGALHDEPRVSKTWLGVGAARDDRAVLAAMEALEQRAVNALAAVRTDASMELRALVERSICASEARQSWLRTHRQDDAA